jgi:hypothetical protein
MPYVGQAEWGEQPSMGSVAIFQPGVDATQAQRGTPQPEGFDQMRNPPWSHRAPFGGTIFCAPRRSDMGAAGYVSNFGLLFTNPIGAGIVAPNRPQASYGLAGQYIAHTIFWAQQTIPTSIQMGPLTSPDVMLALLGTVNIQAAMRTA